MPSQADEVMKNSRMLRGKGHLWRAFLGIGLLQMDRGGVNFPQVFLKRSRPAPADL